jgi:dihydrolipoamide dehydrogenase
VVEIQFDGAKPPANTTFDTVIDASSNPTASHLDALAIDKAGLERDANGFITVNETMKTSNPRVYAVGDITGTPCYAHRAIAHGRVAGEVIAGQPSAFDAKVIPNVAFTDPEIAWAGLTETNAKANDIPHAIAKIPWGASGRAMGMGRPDGLTKIMYDPETKLVLGVAITGVGATEMIAEAVLAIEMGAELNDLALTIHPHPTCIELIADAARSV